MTIVNNNMAYTIRPHSVIITIILLSWWVNVYCCPPEKLVLGVPLYGRSFILRNANVNGVRAPAIGDGIAGPFTATNGFIGYNEFCSKLLTESWDVRFDHLAKVPYAVQGTNWVSFDNVESVVAKVDYGSKYNLAGVMVWSIETDDFHGICGGEKFPLLKALNRAVGKPIPPSETTTTTTPAPTPNPTTTVSSTTTPASSTTTTESSTTTTTSSTTTSVPNSTSSIVSPAPAGSSTTPKDTQSAPFVCTESGYVADPEDCSSFYVCIALGGDNFHVNKMYCPAGLFWDQTIEASNFPFFVDCIA